MPTSNAKNSKYQKTIRKSDAQLWAFYDAQPASTRRMFQDFPENLWPASTLDHAKGFPEAHRRYLAGLLAIWGPDHPAVIDARQRIAVKGKKITSVLQPDDLADLF